MALLKWESLRKPRIISVNLGYADHSLLRDAVDDSGLDDPDVGTVGSPLVELIGDGEKIFRTFGMAQLRPGTLIKGISRGGHGQLDVLFLRLGNTDKRGFGR